MCRWKELIIGAPFYFNRRQEEGGAVYVFMNENGSFKPKTDLMFTGPSDSGFGMAVSSIGDLNQDGFQGNIPFFLETDTNKCWCVCLANVAECKIFFFPLTCGQKVTHLQ